MIVKANHAPVTQKTKPQLASSSRYYRTREGAARDGFSRDQDRVAQTEVNERIKEARHEHSYRLVLNPGDGHGDTDLKAWTRDTMGALERSDVTWVAYEHTRHSAHDHVHVLALTSEKISRDELRQMRDVSNESWRYHSQSREQQRDTVDTQRQEDRAWSRS